MKIRDVKVYRLAAALAEPFAYSQAWYEHRGALLVEIVAEDGLSGWGEAFCRIVAGACPGHGLTRLSFAPLALRRRRDTGRPRMCAGSFDRQSVCW
jgi:L-alanine-DL-glutamate epimerase-like enolase superfamily enzyme